MRFAAAQLTLVVSSRRVLVPIALLIFAIVGVYAYRRNPVQGSFAVTGTIAAFFCAWLVAAVERKLTPAAGAILTVRAGGAAWRDGDPGRGRGGRRVARVGGVAVRALAARGSGRRRRHRLSVRARPSYAPT